MLFVLVAFLAGVLTVLAPCILPLLPIVIGSSEAGQRRLSKKAMVVISSLSVSVIVFTLLLKASTVLIDIPPSFWTWFSGGVIALVGLSLLFPSVWAVLPGINKLSGNSNQVLTAGHLRGDIWGHALMGLALGPVFTTCSPTYLFIIATVLPASFGIGLVYLLAFTVGLALSLVAIAILGQSLVGTISQHSTATATVKKVFGALILVVGISIITGYDKKLEAYILDSGYGATINFEEGLIDRFGK